MTVLEKIGWGFVGLLVLLAVALMFFINWLLGLLFIIFCTIVIWYVVGVLKKRVDSEISAAAKYVGLNFKRHPLRYASLEGMYEGGKACVNYRGTSSMGAGFGLHVITGSPGWAALDIKNVTEVSIEHGLDVSRKCVLDHGPPLIVVNKSKIIICLPGIRTNKREIKEALDNVILKRDELAKSSSSQKGNIL